MPKYSTLKPSLSTRNAYLLKIQLFLGSGALSLLLLAGLGLSAWQDNVNALPETQNEIVSKADYAWVPPTRDLKGKQVEYRIFLNKLGCDDCSEEVELGFPFAFWGETYHTAFLNANGNLSFGKANATFTPEPFCLEGPKMIAPFFADVDLGEGGRIFHYADPEGHYFVACWEEVAYYGRGERTEQHNTFQLILTDGSIRSIGDYEVPAGANILFSYADMQWTTGTSSGGSEGLGGVGATVGLNAGDGQNCEDYGVFDREGTDYQGNFQDQQQAGNAVSHLDFRTLAFGSPDFNPVDDPILVQAPEPDFSSMQILSTGPNPFSDHLNVRLKLEENGPVYCRLVDMAGRVSLTEEFSGQSGLNEQALSVPDLPGGQYVLHISAGGSQQFVNLVRLPR